MKQHKHYQAIRALADGWRIEGRDPYSKDRAWTGEHIELGESYEIRIVPDEEGWLPWYATATSKCPVDENQLVKVCDTEVCTSNKAGNFLWDLNPLQVPIVAYRLIEENDPHKEFKDAIKAGKTVQFNRRVAMLNSYDEDHWVDVSPTTHLWKWPVSVYRIKQPEMKLMAYVDIEDGDLRWLKEPYPEMGDEWKRVPGEDKVVVYTDE